MDFSSILGPILAGQGSAIILNQQKTITTNLSITLPTMKNTSYTSLEEQVKDYFALDNISIKEDTEEKFNLKKFHKKNKAKI